MECQTVLEHPSQQHVHAHAAAMDAMAEQPAELSSCRNGSAVVGLVAGQLRRSRDRDTCRVTDVDMEEQEKAGPVADVCGSKTGSLASEAAEPGGDAANLPFSKELITFALFGKMPTKSKHDCLNSRIAEVQQAFHNIPQMLYFSSSSVSFDGIGVFAAESLPKDTLLGPYLGKAVRKDQVEPDQNNQWLWEVYEDASLSYFIDARDPKYGNWMNFIQCARNSLEQNLRMAQYNNSLYFVVTADIKVEDELLVWYDQDQYGIYMGLPTGFREVPPPPLFLEQQHAAQESTATGDTTPSVPPPPLHDHDPRAPPTYCTNTSRCAGSSSVSDSASTDDSGLNMEKSGGPTPTLPTTYDLMESHNSSSHKDGGNLPTEGACNGIYTLASSHQLAGMMVTTASLPSSSDEGFANSVGLESTSAEQLQQWYVASPLNNATTTEKMATPQNSPAHTPSDGSAAWMGSTRPFVESPTGLTAMGMMQEGVANKKHLLYGLFSRSGDGSRWLCEECKRLFSSQGSLRAHARIHTGERPYQCQYCFRAFCQASTLRSHERLHTGEKPYKCEDCGRAFTQSAGLRSHRKTHRYDS